MLKFDLDFGGSTLVGIEKYVKVLMIWDEEDWE